MKSATLAAVSLILAISPTARAGGLDVNLNLELVPVANPGNIADTTGYGAVSYHYNIGKYEVTASQYTLFLNSVASTDTYGLYNPNMFSQPQGCMIARIGAPGNYTYEVANAYANTPVNFVSWGDAARFANWLTNGQPVGPQILSTTESGSYDLNGATDMATLTWSSRTSPQDGGRYYIPTENEWYKAAYHKNDGPTGNYWPFPTQSNAIDTTMANYSLGSTTIEVGSYADYPGPYGTFDQGGNVSEWLEAVKFGGFVNSRVLRGGAFDSGIWNLHRSDFEIQSATSETYRWGFRVVEVIPEPASILLLLSAAAGYVMRRRKG